MSVTKNNKRELFKKEYRKEAKHRINFYLYDFWIVSNSWRLSGCAWPDVSIALWHFDQLLSWHLLVQCMFHSPSSAHVVYFIYRNITSFLQYFNSGVSIYISVYELLFSLKWNGYGLFLQYAENKMEGYIYSIRLVKDAFLFEMIPI